MEAVNIKSLNSVYTKYYYPLSLYHPLSNTSSPTFSYLSFEFSIYKMASWSSFSPERKLNRTNSKHSSKISAAASMYDCDPQESLDGLGFSD